MAQHVLSEQHSAQGRTVAHGAGRGAAADRQAVAAAPAEAGLGKGKDRAARRREGAGSGGTAQTLWKPPSPPVLSHGPVSTGLPRRRGVPEPGQPPRQRESWVGTVRDIVGLSCPEEHKCILQNIILM